MSKRKTATKREGRAGQEENWSVLAWMLAWREAPSGILLAREVNTKTGKGRLLSRDEAREWVVRTWKEFFADPQDVLTAIAFWRRWPRLYCLHRPTSRATIPESFFLEGVSVHTGSAVEVRPDGHERLLWLDLMHAKAERMIGATAEQVGLDGSTIAISGRHCRTALIERPEIGASGDWPECLKCVGHVEPPEALEEIRQAERTMIRLEAKLSSAGRPAAGSAADVDPERRCPARNKTELAARILNRRDKNVRPREVAQKFGNCCLRNEGNGKYSIVLDPRFLDQGEIERLSVPEWPPSPQRA
jgi:hypothetical protein